MRTRRRVRWKAGIRRSSRVFSSSITRSTRRRKNQRTLGMRSRSRIAHSTSAPPATAIQTGREIVSVIAEMAGCPAPGPALRLPAGSGTGLTATAGKGNAGTRRRGGRLAAPRVR